MRNKGKSMVMASFVADSLALGAHWIYEAEKISTNFGKVDTLLKPASDSYHPTKEKGGVHPLWRSVFCSPGIARCEYEF